MFEKTLLDSSSLRASVLKARHWAIAGLAGVAASCLTFFGTLLISRAPETQVLVARCAVVGTVFALYALMVCCVYEDARQLRLRVPIWVGITLLLNLAGFLIYLTYSAWKTGNSKRATLPMAYILEGVLLGMLVLIPLIYTEALPKTILTGIIVAPPPPLPPAPSRTAPAVKVRPRVTRPDTFSAPIVIPKTIADKDEPEAGEQSAPVIALEGVPGGVDGGVTNGILNTILSASASTPPPPPTRVTRFRRIHVGGQVEGARLIYQPEPEYPPLAKLARIQGRVRLEAVISRDGTIENLRLLSGHPLLAKAAIEAVARWRYQPTLLNGDPVEVVTEIEVNFTLTE